MWRRKVLATDSVRWVHQWKCQVKRPRRGAEKNKFQMNYLWKVIAEKRSLILTNCMDESQTGCWSKIMSVDHDVWVCLWIKQNLYAFELGLLSETYCLFLVQKFTYAKMHECRSLLYDIMWKPLRLPTVWSYIDSDFIYLELFMKQC